MSSCTNRLDIHDVLSAEISDSDTFKQARPNSSNVCRETDCGSGETKITVFGCHDPRSADSKYCHMPKLPPIDGSMHAQSSERLRHYTSASDEYMHLGKIVKSTLSGNVDPLFRVDGDPMHGAWIIQKHGR